MKRQPVNIRKFIADVRSGKSDSLLMTEYGLTALRLLKLKNELLTRHLITLEELRSHGRTVKARKRINVERFLYDFRHRSDDLFLMEKYALGPEQLKEVYHSLVERELLTEEEYQGRVLKSESLENIGNRSGTTGSVTDGQVIDLLDEDPEVAMVRSLRGTELPKDFFTDYSGIKIGQGAPKDAKRGDDRMSGSSRPGSGTASPGSPNEPEKPPESSCPKCGHRRSAKGRQRCPSCGTAYPHAGHSEKKDKGSIWDWTWPKK